MTHAKTYGMPRHNSYMDTVPSPTTTGRHLTMQQTHHNHLIQVFKSLHWM